MPELPDLQVFSRNLNKELTGKVVKSITVRNAKKFKTSIEELKEAVEGQPVTRVYREGKELHIEFKNGNVFGLHMMLRGKLYLFEKTNKHKNTVIEILFKDGTGLALADPLEMANATFNPEASKAPDALSREVNYSFLKKKLEGTKAIIKTFLLNQKMIRGIGNAYADEILWDAGISPFSICNKIPDTSIKALDKSIKSVLQKAEKQILKTHPDIIAGEIRDFLEIHNSNKSHSPTGGEIKIKADSRKTYYTEEQELFK